MKRTTKFLISSTFFVAIFVAFFLYRQSLPEDDVYLQPSPGDVVMLYFTAWNEGRYADMYSAVSDGFKKIEPTAIDLLSFKEYVSSQGIVSLALLNVEEVSNDGETAVVAYSVAIVSEDGNRKVFDGEFTLKYRQGDVVQGWKLIHPYGEKVDMT